MNNIADQTPAGLCPSCMHMFRVETPRGSVFIMCKLSKTDPSFAKYPSVPVLECPGYSPEVGKKQSKRKQVKHTSIGP
jgi:hypothetical protein